MDPDPLTAGKLISTLYRLRGELTGHFNDEATRAILREKSRSLKT